MNEIAIVVNYLISQLGNKVFFPDYSAVKDNCLFLFLQEGIEGCDKWYANLLKGEQITKSCGNMETQGNFGKEQGPPWETLINHLTMVSKRHLSIDQLREARRSAEIDVTKKVNKINQLLAARESAYTIQSVLSEQQELLEELKITHAAQSQHHKRNRFMAQATQCSKGIDSFKCLYLSQGFSE